MQASRSSGAYLDRPEIIRANDIVFQPEVTVVLSHAMKKFYEHILTHLVAPPILSVCVAPSTK
jgi:hypothetical protein